MMVQSKILPFLVAATLVFVNLVCPCASASASLEMAGVDAQHHQHGNHQYQEVPAESDCAHQECPDCDSAMASHCKTDPSVVPSTLTKLGLEDDDGFVDALLPFRLTFSTAHTSTGPPLLVPAPRADSPVHRQDLKLE